MTQTDVALYVTSLAGGGAHKMMVHIAKGLTELGYTVDLVLVDKEGPFLKKVPDEVRIIDLDSSRTLFSIPKLINYLNRYNPGTIIATPVIPTIPVTWAKKISKANTKVILRVPVVLSESNIWKNPDGITQEVLPYLVKHSYPQCDEIVAISQGVADDLVSNLNIDRGKISVIYNPSITDETITASTHDVDHPFFSSDAPVIIGVGRLTKQKDFSTLIRAFKEVVSKQDARLIILGEGGERKKLEGLIQKKDLSSKISMPGFVDNPYKYMRQADVFVLSSAWEGFGNVIPEALACGTPVVATDCRSGPREILDNGKYGELVPVGDNKKLCNAIIESLERPDRENKLKKRAEDFHVDNISKEYAKLL